MKYYRYGVTRDVLEVYDLNGQPVCRFHFNDVSPSVFAVDEEQNRLLGYRDVYPDSLLVYQLQGLSKNGKKYPYPERSYRDSSLPATPEPENPKAFVQDVIVYGGTDVSPLYFVYLEGMGIYVPAIGKTNKTRPAPDKQR